MEYRVIIKPFRKGLFDYYVESSPVQGRSHQPLLDACRQLKSMGAPITAKAALYHEKNPMTWTVRCTIGKGAELDVMDGHFAKRKRND